MMVDRLVPRSFLSEHAVCMSVHQRYGMMAQVVPDQVTATRDLNRVSLVLVVGRVASESLRASVGIRWDIENSACWRNGDALLIYKKGCIRVRKCCTYDVRLQEMDGGNYRLFYSSARRTPGYQVIDRSGHIRAREYPTVP